MAKQVNSRMRQKCDTLANWAQSQDPIATEKGREPFVPLEGEIIVISDAFRVGDKSYPGIKIGDDKQTPLANLEYLHGEKEIVSVTRNAEDTGYTVLLSNSESYTLYDGQDGEPGAPGTSVTITSINQNTESGGKSIITFSDGKTLEIYNGIDGAGEPENDPTTTIEAGIYERGESFPYEEQYPGSFDWDPQSVTGQWRGSEEAEWQDFTTIENNGQYEVIIKNNDNTIRSMHPSTEEDYITFSAHQTVDANFKTWFDQVFTKIADINPTHNDLPLMTGEGENSIQQTGVESKAVSQNSMSIGANNIAGVKGYYWDRNNVTFNSDGTVKIPLIKDKHPTTVIGNESNIAVTELDWAIGDNISMEMANQYPFCSTIESIEDITITFDNGLADSNNATGTITTKAVVLNEVPFAKVTFVSLAKEVYDDYSIWAIKRIYDGTNSTITIRSGEVEFGQGAQVFGELNFGGGQNAASFGAQNITLGDNGLTAGRDNITGNAGVTFGHNNLNLGFGTTLIGESNIIKSRRYIDKNGNTAFTDTVGAFGSGTCNLITEWNASAFGRCNKANQRSAEFVIGQFNKETTLEPLFLVGNGGWGASGSDNSEGVANEIIDGGIEAPICRDNAFAVYYNGSATVGSRHILSNKTGIFTAGTHNTIRGLNGAAFGKDNDVKGENCLAIGTGLEVNGPGDAPGVVIGQYNKKDQYRLFVIARGNSDSDRNNDIFTVSGWSGGGRVDVNQPLRITEIHMLKDPANASLGNAFQVNSAGNMTLAGNLTIAGTITAATWTPSEGGY